jgi:hypothetical protein
MEHMGISRWSAVVVPPCERSGLVAVFAVTFGPDQRSGAGRTIGTWLFKPFLDQVPLRPQTCQGAVANPARWRLLGLLADGATRCVCQLQAAAGVSTGLMSYTPDREGHRLSEHRRLRGDEPAPEGPP